ncbi:adaptin N terminal region-domain-containing protein [Amylocystis lapponica]|nr:adaptin N terminal region-domain-containing protein [Amylocystis lapponica]
MATLNLNALTENASRLGMRLQETLSEHTRDLVLARGASSTYLDNPEEKVKNIRKQLDSNSDREKLEAMKRLIALISKGRNVSEFFAQVVKNVASHNLEIRKLVYIYLLRYAEQEPDLALLSINTFQKDLSDSNPLIRAMALRVLSGIRVPMVGSIIVLAIKKCAADISPYVRKNAALAIPKIYSLDPNHQPELITVISTLLRDRSPLSIGSVAVAFETVCPTRLDLLHQHYRRLCRILVDVDEWGQVDLLRLLTRYARTMLPRPSEVLGADDAQDSGIDLDLKLLLSSAEPLFQSQNPAVVLSVARVFYYVGPRSEVPKIILPLMRILHASAEVERVVLAYFLVASHSLSHELAVNYVRFLVRADDVRQVKMDKIQLLRAIITVDNYQALLREFISYADDADDDLVANAIQAIGYCARLIPEATQQCFTALMSFIQSRHDIVVANSVLVLKSLVQSRLHQRTSAADHHPVTSPLAIIERLAYRIDEIHHPKARACVLWLVGHQTNGARGTSIEGIAPWAPDVLRKAAKSFQQETPIAKLQIVTLASKLFVLCPTNAGVDASLSQDEDGHGETGGVVLRREQVRLVLFDAHEDRKSFGSLGAITGKERDGIDPALRDSPDDGSTADGPVTPHSIARSVLPSSRATPVILTPTGTSAPGPDTPQAKGLWTDLDRFYENASDEEEAESGDSDEDESSGEGEEGSTDEDSGDGGSTNDRTTHDSPRYAGYE